MHTNDELPIHLPARIAARELAAHLRDADYSRPDELCRLAAVARTLGFDLDVDLHFLAGLQPRTQLVRACQLANAVIKSTL